MDGSAHQLYLATKKPFRDLDIPPRKLRQPSLEETLFQKFLPYNNPTLHDDDSDSDPYASDHFRIYEFKIRKCTRSRSHDWTDCPFAHPGEKARRRCPRRFSYSGTVCADFRRGSCARGDSCEFAHGVFECWLHPSRYRTEACKDGKNCQRKICFFAHTPRQLRSLSPPETMVSKNSGGHCAYCRCHPGIHHANSPTSILEMEKLSPPASPPFSPAQTGFSPVSRFRTELTQLGKDSKNDLMSPQSIKELMQSMKNMNMNSFIGGNGDDQSLFAFSPSTSSSPCGSGSGRVFVKECNLGMNNNNFNEEKFVNGGAPDLDWVEDLLT